jgi:endonuclease/exonuclease/phosphatase family metal-dependent hydrolase
MQEAKIKYYFYYLQKVNSDMAVYVTGSEKELENWNLSKSIRLDCYKEDIWVKEIILPSKICKFKYFVSFKNSIDSSNIKWLDNKERSISNEELRCLNVEESRKDIKLMSFNLRYQNNIDGIHLWDNRKDLVLQIMMSNCPDFIGLQEGRKKQVEFLIDSLPRNYKYVGHPRSDNVHDEQCGILYDSNKFVVKDFGTFWLSDTPYVSGSITFDNVLPRIVTWIKVYKFANLVEGKDRTYFVFNTHFDHISQESRIKSAQFLVKQIEKIISRSEEKEKVIFISGDFNAEDDEESIITLKENGFISTADEKCNDEKTFHEFSGKADFKIDHIFYKVINCDICKACSEYCVIKDKSSKGIYPSDHYPICATLIC